MKNRSGAIVFNIFLVIGLLFLGVAFYICYDIRAFKASALKTTGVVEELRFSESGAGKSHSSGYTPVIRYNDNIGAEHHYVANFSSNPPAYKIGETVDVYFKADRPADPKLGGWSEYLGAMVLGGLGFVFTMIGGVPRVIMKWRRSGADHLKQSGQLVHADFVGIDVNRNMTVNNAHPHYIRCTWKDPLNGYVHSFKSRAVWSDPTSRIDRQKKIDVYMDPQKPEKYYVDIEFLQEALV